MVGRVLPLRNRPLGVRQRSTIAPACARHRRRPRHGVDEETLAAAARRSQQVWRERLEQKRRRTS